MARATGSINYLEHRTPLKDESGKYQIHPMFVKQDVVDREKMEKRVRDHCAMNVSSFISALETLEDETLYALAEGNEVRVGDMFIVKPKLGMVKHKDKNGIEWKRTYHEGDLIPANEVDICGLEIQPTKEFLERLKRHSNGCSRQYWSVKSTPKEADKEFADIFRRAFASRVFPPEVLRKMGIKHVRGMLLYGPPGCGKTLIARQIGKALNAHEPKIVNGPEILNKYVGESEANIRALFEDAEKEQEEMGDNSDLHIIIFDEIDAICKARGANGDGTGVHDSIVNQLLSKIDGVEALNNVLIIGMTNRKDLIDSALLRPGRLEVHVEIGLPSEEGRVQILKIHTNTMRQN